MKRNTAGFAAWAALAMITPIVSTPAYAETKYDLYQRCIDNSMTSDGSAECIDLRARFQALLNDCMLTMSNRSNPTKASLTSHGYWARFLQCNQSVHQRLGNYGH